MRDYVQWRSRECSSHSACFDLSTDHITCPLVEWFALAGTIVWVADAWLFIVLCGLCGFTMRDIIRGDAHHNSQVVRLMYKQRMWSSLVIYLAVCYPDEGKQARIRIGGFV